MLALTITGADRDMVLMLVNESQGSMKSELVKFEGNSLMVLVYVRLDVRIVSFFQFNFRSSSFRKSDSWKTF
jgi:hypothetical protein